MSARKASCSGPDSSTGGRSMPGMSPSDCARRRTSKAYACQARTSGVLMVAAARRLTRSRSVAADSREGVSTRIRWGSVPAAIRRATPSTTTVLRPVPGAPSTSTGPCPADRSTTVRCAGSSSTGTWAVSVPRGGRTRQEASRCVRMGSSHHVPPTRIRAWVTPSTVVPCPPRTTPTTPPSPPSSTPRSRPPPRVPPLAPNRRPSSPRSSIRSPEPPRIPVTDPPGQHHTGRDQPGRARQSRVRPPHLWRRPRPRGW